MPERKGKKYMVEFLAKWIRDRDMRKEILFNEETVLDRDWPDQSKVLRSFKRNDLITQMVNELEEIGIDVRRLRWEVYGDHDEGGHGKAGFLYEEMYTHVRGIEPNEINREEESIVVVRGHGWDEDIQIEFRPPEGSGSEPGRVLSFRSDVDIYQRVVVQVTLPSPGPWTVHAIGTKNPSEDDKPVVLNVT